MPAGRASASARGRRDPRGGATYRIDWGVSDERSEPTAYSLWYTFASFHHLRCCGATVMMPVLYVSSKAAPSTSPSTRKRSTVLRAGLPSELLEECYALAVGREQQDRSRAEVEYERRRRGRG
ncbi:uncharacterized protein LOC62_05G007188 [Vanrija pseudolonga]|uniref:Uncharacterized protein n=1 Tax=Vanrija pseudolonga TaxID=143232 RepID=A0AAF1BK79_9TREE|nr:hypothetical protein LOC62_05G007188 [Vanrija pseudolonga]WOO83668.1 hypothetical protein LOC62_05G007188 [Vanrija pseudolonga]